LAVRGHGPGSSKFVLDDAAGPPDNRGMPEPADEFPHFDLVKTIIRRFFADSDRNLVVEASMTQVPLIVANAARSTHSFAAGQRLYVFNGYWGMNERIRVVARFRERHRFVRGVFPIAGLTNCRPGIVQHPAVIRRLAGEMISSGMFAGIGALPVYFVPDRSRPFAELRREVLESTPPGLGPREGTFHDVTNCAT
jgi:hypothetical protein